MRCANRRWLPAWCGAMTLRSGSDMPATFSLVPCTWGRNVKVRADRCEEAGRVSGIERRPYRPPLSGRALGSDGRCMPTVLRFVCRSVQCPGSHAETSGATSPDQGLSVNADQPVVRHARRVGAVAVCALAVSTLATVVPGPSTATFPAFARVAVPPAYPAPIALVSFSRKVEAPLVPLPREVPPVVTPTVVSRASTRPAIASPRRPSTVAAYKSWARGYMARTYRWTSPEQFTCLDNLWIHESQWNPRARNPSSGALGIPQALPAWKMSAAGSDWRTNPVTQMAWGLGYIKTRYGNPCSAWSQYQQKNWY